MGHIQARTPNEVVPGAMQVGPTEIGMLVELLADGHDLEVTTSRFNRAWMWGEISGVSAPIIAADGTVIDPDKQRAYSLSEVAALAALPEVVEGVKALAEERRRDARVQQLGRAREAKAFKALVSSAKAERDRCPLLYRQVEQLTAAVEWLMDRSFDEHPAFERVLPELNDEESQELKY